MNPISVDRVDESTCPLLPGGAVALGFFDGCHRGHTSILQTALQVGREGAAVLTFPEHPSSVIPGRQPPSLITDGPERIQALQDLGLQVYLRTFDREFSTWSAERFVKEILVEVLGVGHVVVGRNYRFGHRAAGDVQRLAEWGEQYGFQTHVVPPITHPAPEPFVVSSTRVRQAIAEGELELAQELLGRPYSVSGVVKEGQRLGRAMGFPTANLALPTEKVQPPFGVYAVRARLASGQTWDGVANFGRRPTVESNEDVEPRLEVHLFDDEPELYSSELTVEFCSFLRTEKRFPDISVLKDQIQTDLLNAKSYFARTRA